MLQVRGVGFRKMDFEFPANCCTVVLPMSKAHVKIPSPYTSKWKDSNLVLLTR